MIHGLNLGANDRAMAADEAAYALKVGGPTLLAFEIGNEPDLYTGRYKIRPNSYGYAQYLSEVEAYRQAILAKSPEAMLAGPATTRPRSSKGPQIAVWGRA